MQSCETLCYQGLKFLCTEFLSLTSSSPVPGSEGRDGAREPSQSLLGDAPWRWEQLLSKAVLCLTHFYLVLCFPLAAPGRAGKGQVLSVAGQGRVLVLGAGAARARILAACARSRVHVPRERLTSPAVSSPRPALPEPFGSAVSQPASPGLLWQRLTLKNQLCLCL